MKINKLILFIEMVCMYQIALSDNGVIKLVSWILLIGLFMVLLVRLEKRYGINQ